ncbi:MAG: NAD(+) diphosphatase [Paracoccaceae bacterium]
MRQAETVTFGGSGLDRAQHLRGDAAALQSAWTGARVLALWRGRVLAAADDQGRATGLVWLPADHPLLQGPLDRLFLGHSDGTARFAADVSATLAEAGPLPGPFDPGLHPHPALPPDQGFADLRGLMALLSPRDAELAAMAKALAEWHRTHGFCATCGSRSLPTQGGWQRQCPACDAPHFPRTDPVVIMLVTHGNDVLLGRSPGWPEGMYSLLAGFVEPGETVEAAVRREVSEETGIRIGAVGYGQPALALPGQPDAGLPRPATSSAITLDPAELQDARWISREDMVQAFAGTHPDIRPARQGSIAHSILQAWLADRLD